MDFEKSKAILFRLALLFFALAAMIYIVAGNSFHYEAVVGDSLSPVGVIGELTDETVVEQRLLLPADVVDSVELQTSTFARQNTGLLNVEIVAEDGAVLAAAQADVASFEDGQFAHIAFQEQIAGRRGQYVTLRLTSQGCAWGNAASLYYGNSVRTGRFDIIANVAEADLFRVNGEAGAGRLCAYFCGVNQLIVYRIYWPLIVGLFAVIAGVCRGWWMQAKRGRNNPLVMLCTMMTKYSFLIKQLVSRDFKAKYKRSALGIGWSFLNPLLTMAVQFVVFSTLFSNGTKNYPVYLLSGIVFFNFFNEAVGMGMTSITGNAALLKKVYIPKYIFPVTRVLSSMINLGTSMIPLVLVMLLTGTWPKPSILLLVFDVICLLMFVIGMVLILSTSMTFFQDTQFLWGVFSMIWMYLTPLFYTENIIPEKLLTLYHMNPMYQYITFARICIIDGASPSPMAYVWCMLSAVVVLLLGVLVFKKNQDKFALYL